MAQVVVGQAVRIAVDAALVVVEELRDVGHLAAADAHRHPLLHAVLKRQNKKTNDDRFINKSSTTWRVRVSEQSKGKSNRSRAHRNNSISINNDQTIRMTVEMVTARASS